MSPTPPLFDVDDSQAQASYFAPPPLTTHLFATDQPGQALVFSHVEMPLIPVLVAMERQGILVNADYLHTLGARLERENAALTERIFAVAGQEFNLNSGQQLAQVLFDHLGLEPVRKTKTGYSTDAATLGKLKSQHEIIPLLLDYRHREKLRNTYVVPLPGLISPTTGRVHTSYNQAVASTGRLSSSSPNLQNIPIRTPLGQSIRRAFEAAPGMRLLSLDYSQIELRIMAHFSQDTQLCDDFAHDRDIHTATAQRIFKLSRSDLVTKQQRSIAKAINFAILYGAGPRNIAENANISFSDAKEFVERYFNHYPGIRCCMDGLKEQARQQGYASTLLGRRLALPDLTGGAAQFRAAAERVALNMPLQGTAADIMKLAMIAVFRWLQRQPADEAALLLQVHDELVLEVHQDRIAYYADAIKHEMESVVRLAVPLTVDVQVGENWAELE